MKITRHLLPLLALTGAVVCAQAQSPNSSQSPQATSQQLSGQSSAEARQKRDSVQPGSEAHKQQLKVNEGDLQNEVTDANKASKIIGKEVRNTQNEKVGKVKDLVIDTRAGRIAYAVLSTGGGMFGSGKLIAVPLDALSLKPGEEHFLIDAAKDRLAAAPGFSEDNWPKLNAAEGDKTIGLSASTDESTQQKAAEEQEDESDDEEKRATNATDPNRPREKRPDQR